MVYRGSPGIDFEFFETASPHYRPIFLVAILDSTLQIYRNMILVIYSTRPVTLGGPKTT